MIITWFDAPMLIIIVMVVLCILLLGGGLILGAIALVADSDWPFFAKLIVIIFALACIVVAVMILNGQLVIQ